MSKQKIGIIGAGNMGAAIISGIRRKYSVHVSEQDRARARVIKKKFRVASKDIRAVAKNCSVIILAVKPQNFDSVLKNLKEHLSKRHIVVSIAAGITTTYIEKRLGGRVRVIRTMPNLPAQTGKGITGLCKGRYAKASDLRSAQRTFDLIGETVVVQEKLMDAVTAVSGSGPAYFFYFVENLEKAARSLGVKDTVAKKLVQETLRGSLSLLEQSNERASDLRKKVTSKGGTTQAALKVFDRKKVDKTIKQAVTSAKKRAKQLSK